MPAFHIHVDAVWLSPLFESLLVGLGFERTDFLPHLDETESYEPAHHLTAKPTSSRELKETFRTLVQHASQGGMEGYLEAEVLPFDIDLPVHPFDPSVPIPFTLTRAALPAGTFREAELHVTLHREASDPRLIRALMGMGAFTAFLSKSYGEAELFTIQGSGQVIKDLVGPLLGYLRLAGGAVAGSVKEERIASWWISRPDVRVPPVVDRVLWQPQQAAPETSSVGAAIEGGNLGSSAHPLNAV